MILDQVEEELAPVRFRRIPRGRQRGADPAPAGGTLVFRLVLEARHMPIDLVAQVGKGLAQDRLDLESSSRAAITPDGSCRRRLTLMRFLPLVCEATTSSRTRSSRKRARCGSLPQFFLDDLRRALLAVPVEIAE